MTSFMLKVFACVTMFIDHVTYILPKRLLELNYIGRLAFPIFAYQISEGYKHTKSLKKYFLRLLVFAFISEIPFFLFHKIVTGSSSLALNVMFTLLLGLICIYFWDKSPNKFLSLFVIFMACLTAQTCNMDYGYFGVLVVLCFHIFKENKPLMTASFFALVLIKFMPVFIRTNFYYPNIILAVCTFLAIVPILLYNGKQGKKIKYLLYIFYPAHLMIFWLIHSFL